MKIKLAFFSLIGILILFFSACSGQTGIAAKIAALTEEKIQAGENTVPAIGSTVLPTDTLVPTSAPTFTPTQQSTGISREVGPQLADFPPGINPLTGLPVVDPSLLELPAILISIPNFPVSARPQAGLSFAPWTFEIYIGFGESRFLSAFYGEAPQVTPSLNGSCKKSQGGVYANSNFVG